MIIIIFHEYHGFLFKNLEEFQKMECPQAWEFYFQNANPPPPPPPISIFGQHALLGTSTIRKYNDVRALQLNLKIQEKQQNHS